MKIPDIPANESERLQALKYSGLLEHSSSERFDRLTRLAKRLFDVPVALLSLVDQDRVFHKSSVGFTDPEVPRSSSFCGHAILQSDPLVVPDALADERFADNPYVVGPPHVRFYAGFPVKLPDGAVAGSFCVVDLRPRDFQPHDLQTLRDLAAIVEDEFAVLNAATTDELTGLLNRRGFNVLGRYALLNQRRRAEPVTLAFIDLDRFKQINDTWGHAAGDEALLAMARLMGEAFRDSDLLARPGGDEFSILFNDTDEQGAWIAMQYLQEKVTQFNQQRRHPWQLIFSWGVIQYDEQLHGSLEALLAAGDAQMYAMKKQERGTDC